MFLLFDHFHPFFPFLQLLATTTPRNADFLTPFNNTENWVEKSTDGLDQGKAMMLSVFDLIPWGIYLEPVKERAFSAWCQNPLMHPSWPLVTLSLCATVSLGSEKKKYAGRERNESLSATASSWSYSKPSSFHLASHFSYLKPCNSNTNHRANYTCYTREWQSGQHKTKHLMTDWRLEVKAESCFHI